MYVYIYKLYGTVLQFFIFDYLNQARKVPVITCDKIINIAGFQQFSSTVFTYGQPCTAEGALVFLAAPLPRVAASRAGPGRKMVWAWLSHSSPMPSLLIEMAVKPGKTQSLWICTQATKVHINIPLGFPGKATSDSGGTYHWEQQQFQTGVSICLSSLPTCPFCYTWVKDMYHGNLIKKEHDHTLCKWFSFVLELFGLEL